MLETLINKLHTYLIENNPDLLIELQEEEQLAPYLQDKMKSIEQMLWQFQEDEAPDYIIEEICMDALTEDLKPSRFNYICSVLSADFPEQYESFREKGILTYEGVNLVTKCKPLFDSIGFSAPTENSPVLRQVISGIIREFLQIK